MPAKKKPAPKAPAKPAKKVTAKPAPKKAAKPAPKKAAKPAPKSKPAAKPAAKVVKKAAKPASPSKKPIVKKTSAKPATKSTPTSSAKKPATKAAPASALKKQPAKAPAAAIKEPAKPAPKTVAKPVAATKAAPVATKTAPAQAPAKAAPAAVKKAKEAAAPTATKTGKTSASPAPAPVHKNLPKMPSGRRGRIEDEGITLEAPKKPVLPAAFLKKQRQRLVELRDAYLNSAEGVANESLRGGSDGGDASAFGMHQADAGSDAYDRDFALSLLAKEQDAIYEINEALKRIDVGTYGLCEMSADIIPEERLEALPFTRFTVACQERIEREQMGGRWNRPVRSLFGLDEAAEDSDDEREEEETTPSNSESLDFSKE